MATIPSSTSSGSTAPVSQTISVAGSTNLADLAIPAGRDVTIYQTAAGGGGGAGGTAAGGAGAGSGGFACFKVPHALWALGGTMVIGAAGTGGAVASADGTDAADCVLTINSIVVATVGGGKKGDSSPDGEPGLGGTVTIDASLTTYQTKAGNPGVAPSGTNGGVGGSGSGPGGGTGGTGGTASVVGGAGGASGGGGGGGSVAHAAGGAGGAPRTVLTY